MAGNTSDASSGHTIINNVPAPAGVTIESAAITSTPVADGSYATGEAIEVTVTFSEAVTVDTTDGTPRLPIDLGPGDDDRRQAAYTGGSNTAALVFSYTVAAGDESGTTGIGISDSIGTALGLDLNGGTIQAVAGGADADLSFGPVAGNPAHRVNWVRPALAENGAATSTDGARILLTFDEALLFAGTTAQYTVKVDGTEVGVIRPDRGRAVLSGSTVTLTLAAAVTHGQRVTVSYTDPSEGDDTDVLEEALAELLHRHRLPARVPGGRGIEAALGIGDCRHGPAPGGLGRHRAVAAQGDSAQPPVGAELGDVVLAPGAAHPDAEAGEIGIPVELLCPIALELVDHALGDLEVCGHGGLSNDAVGETLAHWESHGNHQESISRALRDPSDHEEGVYFTRQDSVIQREITLQGTEGLWRGIQAI